MATLESNAPRGPVAWVLDRTDLETLIEQLRTSAEVVMDHETTGLDEHAVTRGLSNGGVAARIALTSLTITQKDPEDGTWDGKKPTTWVVPLSHPQSPWLGNWRKVMGLIAKSIAKHRLNFVNHHAKFDARWTKALTGIDIADRIVWDTMHGAHLIDETAPKALKECVPAIFGIERWDDHDLSKPGAAEHVDLWELGEYAARDTYWTWELYRWQLATLFLDPEDPFAMPIGAEETRMARIGTVAEVVSMPTARSLAKLEQRGIRLDVDYTRELYAERSRTATEKLDELAEYARMSREDASLHATSGWFKRLTEDAVARGELRVMSVTKGGAPQWNKHVLRKQAARGSTIAQLVLEGRDAAKQAEFLGSWLEKVTPEGLIHSTYKAAQVVTGRLSSADPNMQQVSKKLRQAFIPRPGKVIADFDYSQLELRVAAFVSRSEPMIEAFKADQDLHRLFAAQQLTRRARALDPNAPEVALEDVPDDERQKAKAGNFGLLYLQSPEGFRNYADLVYGVELTAAEALEVYEGFFDTWTGMAEWHQRTIEKARRNLYVVSPIGRVRNLPNIIDRNEYYRSEAERQAVNAPVQGFGSDLMQMAIASIYGLLPGTSRIAGVEPVATVHDSLVAELDEDRWEELVPLCQERMVNLDEQLRKMDCELDVPLKADATVGTRWGLSDISGE